MPSISSTATVSRAGFRRSGDGWSNPKILTLFLLLFLCGLTCGAFVARAFLHARQPVVKTDRLEELTRELQLTPDQKRVVMGVLDDYAKYYQNLEEDRENVAEHGKTQILRVLNPSQQRRFLEIYKPAELPGDGSHPK